ncbi:hypothetical protein CHUAL_012115 [Chamberlinius hualienensis]
MINIEKLVKSDLHKEMISPSQNGGQRNSCFYCKYLLRRIRYYLNVHLYKVKLCVLDQSLTSPSIASGC